MLIPKSLLIVSLAALASGASAAGTASELVLLPESATLDGPHAAQRFLVEIRDEGKFVGERTEATFAVDNPLVARVADDGTVTPVGDGAANLLATIDGRVIRAPIQVRQSKKEESWTFRNHVQPVLTKAGCNSGACHGAAAGKNGFRLTLRGYGAETDYDVLTRQSLGRRIVATAPAESLLLLKPTAAVEHGGGRRFAPGSLSYRIISEWIASGAPPPRPDDPRVVGLKVHPTAVTLTKGRNQRFLVQAVYSDGRVEDVSHLAKYSGTDDSVAKVDDSGQVHVEGHGEAAVAVWFSSFVQRATVTSPYEAAIDPKVYANAPRNNFIDECNLRKLSALRISPAGDAGDGAFLRRASLDSTGTLPPVEAAESFLGNTNPKKRAKLIDGLLNSPEYVDYWTYKWSDLFLVSSNKLPKPAMWAFHRFVRRNVAENRPWDRFARDVVTAKGSGLENGAANYFVLHRDPIELTESSSMAFLGLSLMCARCHNHPLEKWTQDQYYGMAALFSRVRLKDGASAGDVIVMPAESGAIRHPRTGAVVPPRPLDGASLAVDSALDRREAFADWLARPDNPYFDRAIINRVWRNFFGRGLIDPEDDLRATNPPSDEPLLDALVADFRAHHRDLKHLIRTIMNSAVYARSSVPAPGDSSDAKFVSRYPVKRLSAEVLLDAIARVTGVSTGFTGYPTGWRSLQLPDSKVESAFLTSFGRPERLATCSCERSSEPSMAQALHLANGATVNEKLRSPDGVVSKILASKADDAAILDRLFLAALTRRPTPRERERLLKLLSDAEAGLADPKAKADARRQAVEDLYWATLTGNDFLFNH